MMPRCSSAHACFLTRFSRGKLFKDGLAGLLAWLALWAAPSQGASAFLPFPGTVTTTHAEGSVHSSNLPLTITFFDPETVLDPASLVLIVDGIPVTSNVTLKAIPLGLKLSYPWDLRRDEGHDYAVIVSDIGAPPRDYLFAARFAADVRGSDDFLVELEDFNYSKGEFKSSASKMPYYGLAYRGESSSDGTDYFLGDPPAEFPNNYRDGEKPNVPLLPGIDRERSGYLADGTWVLATGPGDWFNYTRKFPTNTFDVYAALSRGDVPSGLLSANLYQVSNPTSTHQNLTPLGLFKAYAGSGWGDNVLTPLTDTTGEPVALTLGGTTTLRFECGQGLADYLVFTPTRQLRFTVTRREGDHLILEWIGDGQLLESRDLNGSFSPVGGDATHSARVLLDGSQHFFRLHRRGEPLPSDYED